MFGADTPLVMDALQIAALAAAASACGFVWVQFATHHTADLAKEIEALRSAKQSSKIEPSENSPDIQLQGEAR